MKPYGVALILLLMMGIAPVATAEANSGATGIQSAPDSGKDEDIRQLFAVMGLNKLGEQIWDQLVERITKLNRQVPESVWQEIDKEFRSDFSSGKFEQLLIPIYRKYFNGEEIKQLILFYQSPIGKKLLYVQPQLAGDAMTAGMERGREIMKRIQERLKQKGYAIQAD